MRARFLAIIARKKDNRMAGVVMAGLPDISGPSCVIGRDGSYDLPLAKGSYSLAVVDLATGLTLQRAEEPVEVRAGKTAGADLSLELALVRVTLVPAREDGVIAASNLYVDLGWPQQQNGVDIVVMEGFGVGMGSKGVPLGDGQREVTLYLPAREAKLRVMSNVGTLSKGPVPTTRPLLGERELNVQMGKTNRVRIEVKPPPDIDDTAKKELPRQVKIRKR